MSNKQAKLMTIALKRQQPGIPQKNKRVFVDFQSKLF